MTIRALLLGIGLVLLLEACDSTEPADDDDISSTDADHDGFGEDVDCDDGDAAVYPGAEELCDGLDNNCDDEIPVEEIDGDGDGVSSCEGDCDDGDAARHPGAAEACDGLDNDCDGVVPDDETDGDGDGVSSCAGDCDDEAGDVYPGAEEVCDGLDNDCEDGVPDDERDGDGDGVSDCAGDCDDEDAAVFPGAEEVCNGADDDCDGVVPDDETDGDGDGALACEDCDDDDADLDPLDHDGDGVSSCDGDCDDGDPTRHPGAVELCNGVDDDCDGVVPADENDGDGDGHLACEDCDDEAAATHPGAAELCDGLDNDCDGAAGADEVDADGDGSMACAGDCDDGDATVFPGAPDVCDGVMDNDCDGLDDASEVDGDGDGYSGCAGDCDDTRADVLPGGAEITCDGLDNDCDPATLDGPGFTELQAVLDMASAGDTIELCPGTYTGSVVVDEAISLAGAGMASTFVEGDLWSPSITIIADGVALSDLGVTGTGDGVAIDGAEQVTVERVAVTDGGGSGLALVDAQATIVGCELSGNPIAGVSGTDSELHVSDCVIDTGWAGIHAVGAGASPSTVTGNTISDVSSFGILLAQQDSEIVDNTLINTHAHNDAVGISAGHDGGALRVEGNTVEGFHGHGIWVQHPYMDTPTGGAATVTDNVVTDGVLFGLLAEQLDDLVLHSNTFEGIQWGGALVGGGYADGFGVSIYGVASADIANNRIADIDVVGIFVADSTFTSTGDEITATHLWGAYVSESPGTITDLDLHDVAILGVQVQGSDVAMESSSIANIHEAIQPSEWGVPGAYPWSAFGLAGYSTSLSMSEVSVTGVDYYGIYVNDTSLDLVSSTVSSSYTGLGVYGGSADGYVVTVTDVEFLDNSYTGVWGYDTDASFTDCTFSGNGEYGAHLTSFDGLVTNSTFVDTGQAVYLYAYDPSLVDQPARFISNQFQSCEAGISSPAGQAGETVVQGCTFDDLAAPVSMGGNLFGHDSSLWLHGNTFTSSGGTVVEVESLTELILDGVQTIAGTTAESALVISDVGSLTIEDLTVSGAAIHGIELSGEVSGTIYGNTLENNLQYGIACDSADVALSSCENWQSGNGLGDFLETGGCVLGCGLL